MVTFEFKVDERIIEQYKDVNSVQGYIESITAVGVKVIDVIGGSGITLNDYKQYTILYQARTQKGNEVLRKRQAEIICLKTTDNPDDVETLLDMGINDDGIYKLSQWARTFGVSIITMQRSFSDIIKTIKIRK